MIDVIADMGVTAGVLVGFFLGAVTMYGYYCFKVSSLRDEMSLMAQIGANMQAQRDAAIKTIDAKNLDADYQERLTDERNALRALAEAKGIDPDEFVIVDRLEGDMRGMDPEDVDFEP